MFAELQKHMQGNPNNMTYITEAVGPVGLFLSFLTSYDYLQDFFITQLFPPIIHEITGM